MTIHPEGKSCSDLGSRACCQRPFSEETNAAAAAAAGEFASGALAGGSGGSRRPGRVAAGTSLLARAQGLMGRAPGAPGRGLHSSTSQLNLSRV